MKWVLKFFLLAVIPFLAATALADTNELALIPEPQKVTTLVGSFLITPHTRIYADGDSLKTAELVAERLRQSTGYPLKVHRRWFSAVPVENAIFFTIRNADSRLGPEGYSLHVANNFIAIRAPTQVGLFYGGQTLLQLLPPEIFSTNTVVRDWVVPSVLIEDWPRFPWRGLMLDVSRHFFNKAEVEALLDEMSLYKLNRFHWHLVDDQGWRIQIKKYPRLTEVGAWRAGVGFGFPSNSTVAYGLAGRYGGFYTQNDIRDVVKYAAARHITIVPEIEMPGHSSAALAAYPQYSCTGGPFEPQMTAGIFNGIYDPAKEETFQFLAEVIAEVSPLFPGKYFHIGGDEVPKETWHNSADCQALMKREGLKNEEELQSWFIRRIEKIVNANGHSMIGWSEILQGGLAKNAAVMDWIGGAEEAASAGHNVVMTPTAYCYFDFYQSTNRAAEPRAATWGGPLTLSKMYAFDPMPTGLPPQLQSYILGAQGNLWTEWVPNLKHAEYMTFPRLCALAEDTWSAKDSKNWDDFMQRLQIHVRRFDEQGINYRHASIAKSESSSLK
jgi:hexosaminidase